MKKFDSNLKVIIITGSISGYNNDDCDENRVKEEPAEVEPEKNTIIIHITGEVKNTGIIEIEEGGAKEEGVLFGKSFCFTGELVTMKRSQAQELVKKNGGTVKSSVVKDLSYLVTNDTSSGSSKNVKAASLGIPVISEF